VRLGRGGRRQQGMQEGRGSATPSLPAEVNITLGGELRDLVVSGAGRMIAAAVERAICTMREGEKARIEWTEADGTASEVEIELHSWMSMLDVEGDGSVLVKPVCTPEPAGNKPRTVDMVRIRYCGRVLDGDDGVFVNEGFGPAWEDGPDAAVVPRKCQLSKIEPEGLQVALQHMWQGCSFMVELQPQRAFGAASACVSGRLIPGASTIEFKVELCEVSTVQDLSGDGGVVLETLFEPANLAAVVRPMEGSTCCLTYQSAVQGDGPWAGRQYESFQERYVCIGQHDSPLTDGLERAVQAMVQGQACMVRVSPEYAYGDEGFQGNEGRVASRKAVEHRVTLLDFKAAGASGGGFKAMAFEEQVSFAKTVKEVLFSRSRGAGREKVGGACRSGSGGPCG